ncbi:MAG: hypothetical protein M3362_01630 [Acidobacteriota bacterium]|nr:hypothetical protein [Acidobacteriota bacterium]
MAGGALLRVSWVAAEAGVSTTHPNNGMHPTADTRLVINLYGAARRVMPGVRPLF